MFYTVLQMTQRLITAIKIHTDVPINNGRQPALRKSFGVSEAPTQNNVTTNNR